MRISGKARELTTSRAIVPRRLPTSPPIRARPIAGRSPRPRLRASPPWRRPRLKIAAWLRNRTLRPASGVWKRKKIGTTIQESPAPATAARQTTAEGTQDRRARRARRQAADQGKTDRQDDPQQAETGRRLLPLHDPLRRDLDLRIHRDLLVTAHLPEIRWINRLVLDPEHREDRLAPAQAIRPETRPAARVRSQSGSRLVIPPGVVSERGESSGPAAALVASADSRIGCDWSAFMAPILPRHVLQAPAPFGDPSPLPPAAGNSTTPSAILVRSHSGMQPPSKILGLRRGGSSLWKHTHVSAKFARRKSTQKMFDIAAGPCICFVFLAHSAFSHRVLALLIISFDRSGRWLWPLWVSRVFGTLPRPATIAHPLEESYLIHEIENVVHLDCPRGIVPGVRGVFGVQPTRQPRAAKPTEAVAPAKAVEVQPHKTKKGDEYGAGDRYQKAMEKRFKTN